MPRVKHYFEDGQYVHITTRTMERIPHLASDEAKTVVLSALRAYADKRFYRLLAYVIMDNHCHFVVQVLDAKGFSQAVGRIKGWTSNQIRRLLGHRGSLWERRFDDNVIQTDMELAQVVDYVHFNPVRAGIVASPEDYTWSSARRWKARSFPDL